MKSEIVHTEYKYQIIYMNFLAVSLTVSTVYLVTLAYLLLSVVYILIDIFEVTTK